MGAEKAAWNSASAQPSQGEEAVPSALASPSPVEINKVRSDSSRESDRRRKTSTSNSEFQM